jgi:hypothetical protein
VEEKPPDAKLIVETLKGLGYTIERKQYDHGCWWAAYAPSDLGGQKVLEIEAISEDNGDEVMRGSVYLANLRALALLGRLGLACVLALVAPHNKW